MRARSRLLRLALPLLAAVLAAACGRVGKDQEAVINRRLEGEPRALNPLLATSDPENVVLALLSRNLLDYDEKLNLVPGLAASVESDPAHLVYTVKLRPGETWEDGSPVTADDVAYTLQAIVDPKTPALYRKSLFDAMEKAEVVDPLTARVTFSRPSVGQRDAFNLPLLPAKLYRGTDLTSNPRNRRPLANGPFRLADWEPGRLLRLVRNTQYFGERPAAEQVVFRVVPETASAFPSFRSGGLDEMRLTAALKAEVDASGGRQRSLVYDELAYTYIAWNNRLPFFDDARTRRALTMLIDRETIARTLYGGLARPANGPVPPGLWSHDASLPPWPYDPAKAAALLDEAGWRKGPDGLRSRAGKRFAFTLSIGAGSERQRQIVELVQRAYRDAGIEMDVRPMEWGAFTTAVDAGDYEACSLALNLDPNPDLAPNFRSTAVPPEGMNHMFYRDPKADALMDEIATTFDREKARALYAELQRVIHEDEPITFLHFVSVSWGVSDRIHHVETSPLGLFLFWPGGAGWTSGRGTAPL